MPIAGLDHTTAVAWGGLIIGLLFGAIGQRTGFCLTRALIQAWHQGDGRRLRAFALAMAVALGGSQILHGLGVVDLSSSLYLQGSFSWLLVPVGGLLFGFGMILANGCGARALVLLGGGNLRSLLVLLCLGISAYAALTGVLAPWRIDALEATSWTPAGQPPHLPALLAEYGIGLRLAEWGVPLVLVVALTFYAVGSPAFRASPRDWLGGIAIGALVPAGWWVTGVVGADDFDPVDLVSLTFVAPVGDGIQYLMLATGTDLAFGVTVVAGVIVGAAASALLTGGWQLQGFDGPRPMLRAIGGGTLMGIGGALALGCSIGQGLSGFSTLALPALLALGGILLGGWAAMALRLART